MTTLLDRKKTHFVLWRPAAAATPPALVIGQFNPATSTLLNLQTLPLALSPISTAGDLWEIPAAACHLTDGQVYHYWFQLPSANPYQTLPGQPIRVTDPVAYTVDWRLTSTVPAGNSADQPYPLAVIRYASGQLVATDPAAVPEPFAAAPDAPMASLPTNNRLVIYELPTAWTRTGTLGNATDIGVGTFQDVFALIEPSAASPGFPTIAILGTGKSYLQDLGINALQLLPPADSFAGRGYWDYATSNYCAPDFDLGLPLGNSAPTATTDFLNLIRACHANGIRYFCDSVMAFADHDPYRAINYLDFHVQWGAGDPEQTGRDGFGGDLWKYGFQTSTYDPISGATGLFYPGRQHMLTHMTWWMTYFHLDGYRLDSVNNVASYDFVNTFRSSARNLWNQRWLAEGNPAGGADSRFLTIGEELSEPTALLGSIDALWNDLFRNRVRNAIIGRNAEGQPSFEQSIREMIDCRNLRDQNGNQRFTDGSQAVNYIGSHDTGNLDGDNTDNDRLYNFLDRFGIVDKDAQLKLAFVCLLTAVGIPMVFAGDEFADPMNILPTNPDFTNLKQLDPIDYALVTTDPWRNSIFLYVANLIKFRTTTDALSVNDTTFLHVDFTEGKRVLAWQRGAPNQAPVVVVANFSAWGTDVSQPNAEYIVNNFPTAPNWREVTQNRPVSPGWAGREAIYPWQAMVYTTT